MPHPTWKKGGDAMDGVTIKILGDHGKNIENGNRIFESDD
jgi:hypothetical protein